MPTLTLGLEKFGYKEHLHHSLGGAGSLVATIVPNVIVKMQLTRMAREHHFQVNERFIDASVHPDWEALALAWVSEGVEPVAP